MAGRLGHRSNKQGIGVMALGLAAACFVAPRNADACGACFTTATESTVVNDHKMALKITNQQTILWDQITYTGNPKEFAYVVPARPGTKLQASNDGFFTALDLTSRPIIMSPPLGGGGGKGGSGCGCGSLSSSDSLATSAGGGNGERVQIVDQSVVGPYETVTLRSTDPRALHEWLNQNGFAMPENAGPIIEQYVNGGFDFIAMRLAPGNDVRSMKPIRIVSPTADPELPLRMMQIGAGAKVGITLYVLAEGRYQPQNFPVVSIDQSKLIWDTTQNRSNYQELSLAAMGQSDGRGMLVEFANKANMQDSGIAYQPTTAGGGMGSNPSLPDAYRGACKPDPKVVPPAPTDSGSDAGGDAGDDAGIDAGTEEPETKECDDIEVLRDSLNTADLWITRIRSNLPNAALAETLRLEAAKQEPVDNVYQVTTTGTISGARIARTGPSPGSALGGATVIAGTIFFLSRVLRRRRHQSKS